LAILILAWVAFFLLLTTTQIQHYDSDIFWALRSGQWILSKWQVPRTDPFSHTFLGRPWIDFTWGFQVIANLFYTRLGKWTGLYILQLLLSFTAFGVLFFNLRSLEKRRLWIGALLMVLVLAGASPRLIIRPHLFGFLFISLYLLILNMNDRRGGFFWPLLLIFPLQVLWVNIHSSSVLGVFIVWSYASGEIIEAFIKEGFRAFKEVISSNKGLFILAVILPFLTLINPYGLKLAIFPFIHQGGANADALRHIGEWLGLPLKEFFLYLYPSPLNYFAFKVLFYIGLLSFFLNRRSLKARDLMLFAGAAYMGISHARWVGQFGFFAAPIIAFNITSYMKARGDDVLPLRWGALGLALFMSISLGLGLKGSEFRQNFGLGESLGKYPVGSVKFMKDKALTGRLYNAYVFGGYIIFHYPELKVFIDGRTPTVYSPHFFWKFRQSSTKAGWERLAGEYDVNMALVKLNLPLCKTLYESGKWSPVVFDDVSVLYLKKDSGFDEVLSKDTLSFSPCSGVTKYVLPAGRNEKLLMKKGLQRVMRSMGDGEGGRGFAYPHRLLGLLEGGMDDKGHMDRSVAEFQKALKIKGEGLTYYDLGLALGKLGRTDEAISAFKTSVRLEKGFKDGYLALGLTYFDKKDYENSARLLEKYLRLADDRAELRALKILGRVYFRLGRLNRAAEILKRALFLAHTKALRGKLQYELGNTLFEAGRLIDGARYYSRAMDNDKGYEKVLLNLAERFSSNKERDKATAMRAILQKVSKKE